ncbi:urea ABC transporter ATP-binding protein UrtD [Paenibacillus sp. Marseille-Q4541]|uniref:urea ABC transporter ATP-binding protein UrtD n=1 Tax=Paenibacillus sp. Marseille-Q4541 TaxID=2831522 RepID=UPI002019D618|nr:urea ABC transporter ATP-binding protein UrtD [Paenibacillus sp. Marseille-Q4541]
MVRDVTVSFSGFVAVRGMNLSLRQRELHFLIGPNGAGKTTMLDVICGKTKPLSGQVLLPDGTDLVRKKEHQVARLGIGRKFQAPSVFGGLTVLENLEIAQDPNKNVFHALRKRRSDRVTSSMEEVLEQIGLGHRLDIRAGSLSHGEKQWLEIGMLLLQEPDVLLLDEPVAGMTDEETDKTGILLTEIAKKRSVVIVEHDMEFVRHYAEKVTVMHEGKLLTEGTMQEVQLNPVVAEVYLGKRRGSDVVAEGD